MRYETAEASLMSLVFQPCTELLRLASLLSH